MYVKDLNGVGYHIIIESQIRIGKERIVCLRGNMSYPINRIPV